MEKMTKGLLAEAFSTPTSSFISKVEEFWKVIEADREAIREETRTEVMKDHFKLGEKVQVRCKPEVTLGWIPGVIGALPEQAARTYSFWKDEEDIRRPAKNRALTRHEKEVALGDSHGIYGLASMISDQALNELCIAARIPTEVEE